MPKPHRLNVVGDFYVAAGCCTLCGVPWAIAPDLFEPHDDGCYVKKQPVTLDQVGKVLEVMRTQELGCVRYRGRDPGVLWVLRESGEAEACDHSRA